MPTRTNDRARATRSPGRIAAIGFVLLVGACSSSSRGTAPATTTLSRTSTTIGNGTTAVPSTAPTQGRDLLPAGAVMLGLRGRTIVALDADGREMKIVLTVAAGRQVTGAQMMSDHETLWYVTSGDPADANRGCPEVVELDLRTNARTIVGYADGFAVTADGSRFVLGPGVYSDVQVRQGCRGDIEDEFAVHDIGQPGVSRAPVAGAPIAASGPLGVAISPSGDRLLTSQCSLDGCGVIELSVPRPLGGPLVWQSSSPVVCSCAHFVTADDGLYAVVDSPPAPKAEIRRFAWADLSGPGSTVFAGSSPTSFEAVVPTVSGLYAFVGDQFSTATSHLYRLAAKRATVIGSSGYSAVVGVPRFAAIAR